MDGFVPCPIGHLRSRVEARVRRWAVRGHIVPSEHLLWSSADNGASSWLHSILGVKRNYTGIGFSSSCWPFFPSNYFTSPANTRVFFMVVGAGSHHYGEFDVILIITIFLHSFFFPYLHAMARKVNTDLFNNRALYQCQAKPGNVNSGLNPS